MRSPYPRPTVVIAVVGVAVLGVSLFLGWDGGFDGTSLPGNAAIRLEVEQDAALEQQRRVLLRSSAAKAAVGRALAAGELTLLEAAARVRDVDRQNPYFVWEMFRRGRSAAADPERHCQEAIACIACYLPDSPEHQECIARYEAELQALLDHGPVHLPEPGPRPEAPRAVAPPGTPSLSPTAAPPARVPFPEFSFPRGRLSE